MKTATKIKTLKLSVGGGYHALYRVEPPMESTAETRFGYLGCELFHYVVVMADVVPAGGGSVPGPETYIFGAMVDEYEELIYTNTEQELEGSYRGSLNHHTAFEGAGYVIVPEKGSA